MAVAGESCNQSRWDELELFFNQVCEGRSLQVFSPCSSHQASQGAYTYKENSQLDSSAVHIWSTYFLVLLLWLDVQRSPCMKLLLPLCPNSSMSLVALPMTMR